MASSIRPREDNDYPRQLVKGGVTGILCMRTHVACTIALLLALAMVDGSRSYVRPPVGVPLPDTSICSYQHQKDADGFKRTYTHELNAQTFCFTYMLNIEHLESHLTNGPRVKILIHAISKNWVPAGPATQLIMENTGQLFRSGKAIS